MEGEKGGEGGWGNGHLHSPLGSDVTYFDLVLGCVKQSEKYFLCHNFNRPLKTMEHQQKRRNSDHANLT